MSLRRTGLARRDSLDRRETSHHALCIGLAGREGNNTAGVDAQTGWRGNRARIASGRISRRRSACTPHVSEQFTALAKIRRLVDERRRRPQDR